MPQYSFICLEYSYILLKISNLSKFSDIKLANIGLTQSAAESARDVEPVW